MHYLDIIILIIVIASMIEGGFQGFIYELFSLVGLIAGFILAIRFFEPVAGYLTFIPIPLWALKVLTFLLILIITNIIFRLIGKSLRLILRKVFMGWLDRFAGVAFGFARGIIIVLLITLIALLTPVSSVIYKEAPGTKLVSSALKVVQPFKEKLVGERTRLPGAI